MKKLLILSILVIFLAVTVFAQHEHHGNNRDSAKMKPSGEDSMAMQDHSSMNKDSNRHLMEVPMSHSFSLNLPMTRNGSGTGWLPDGSPMYGYMIHSGKWMYMAHGSIFFRYDDQDFTNSGIRGDARFDAPSWFMFMGQRKAGSKGLFHFNSMFSLDPILEGGKGYPLLFQTGESYNGQPLVDRQHPHDLISELSVSYSYAFSKTIDAFIYFGYPGEPAIGPVTFMHRPSSLDNPNSPISHHWVDATHVTFGVATLGIRVGKVKIEGSSFTGREPNENRYDFDKPRFDSWSGRISFNPSMNWALQASHGYVKSPEELHPGENVFKTTASALYSADLGNKSRLDATLLWGMNKQKQLDGENAILAEGAWRKKRLTVYTRYEFTQKSGEELVLTPTFDDHELFSMNAFTLGSNFDLFEIHKTKLAIGGQWSVYHSPSSLDRIYGKNPMSLQVYLRVYPSLMKTKMDMR